MAVTKSAVNVASAMVLVGTPTVGSWIDLTASYDTQILVTILNQASAPTVPLTAYIDLSPDNGTTIYLGAGGAFTASSGVGSSYNAEFYLGSAMYARASFSGNTGNSVYVQATATKVTGI